MKNPEFYSTPNEPEVSNFESHGNVLKVKFADGHEMSTCKNTGGQGDSQAIETFSLRTDAQEVARYQSPYQYPRNTDSRNGFVFLESDYTVEQVAEYWASADKHIRALVEEAGGLTELHDHNSAIYDSFVLLSHGHKDMLSVVENRVEIHTH